MLLLSEPYWHLRKAFLHDWRGVEDWRGGTGALDRTWNGLADEPG